MNAYTIVVLNNLSVLAQIFLFVSFSVAAAVLVTGDPSVENSKNAFRASLFGIGLSALVCLVTPTQGQLREAYVMSELAKIATANNAKLTGEALMQRLDKFLECKK